MINPTQLTERFITYIKIDSQSDPESTTTPSTEKQWAIAHLLKDQLDQMGIEDVTLDANGYIMATLPGNVTHDVPAIGFIAHYDTTPDFTGTHVNPQIIKKYNGKTITLNAEKNIVLDPDEFEDLKQYVGQTLITTDGTTLLGADDKAGITAIMEAAQYLIDHPEVKHGPIKIGFTPDEEIGRGVP